jgi:GntR family transcriptional regulator
MHLESRSELCSIKNFTEIPGGIDRFVILFYNSGMQIQTEAKPLDIKVEPKSPMPVYEQVKQGIKLLIISGYLEKGDRLVPIRELAAQLKINPNTIVKVYYQLDIEGFVYSQPGSGYFVKGDLQGRVEEKLELLKRVTEEYISKALKLGFSLQDMIAQLQVKMTGTTGAGGTNA